MFTSQKAPSWKQFENSAYVCTISCNIILYASARFYKNKYPFKWYSYKVLMMISPRCATDFISDNSYETPLDPSSYLFKVYQQAILIESCIFLLFAAGIGNFLWTWTNDIYLNPALKTNCINNFACECCFACSRTKESKFVPLHKEIHH